MINTYDRFPAWSWPAPQNEEPRRPAKYITTRREDITSISAMIEGVEDARCKP